MSLKAKVMVHVVLAMALAIQVLGVTMLASGYTGGHNTIAFCTWFILAFVEPPVVFVLKESAAADELRCAKCRRRRKDWARRLSEWRRSRPAPTPGHCPVCGIKTKAWKPFCSDPCANEAAHWEAVAAWLAGTGPDPTKQTGGNK